MVGTYWFEVGIAWWRPLLDGGLEWEAEYCVWLQICLESVLVERECLRRILYSRATRYFHTTNIANGNPSCFFNPRVLFIYRLLRKSKSMY